MKTILHFFKLVLFVCFLFNLSFSYGQAEHGFIEGVNYKDGVVYKTVGGSNLVMDMFYPDAEILKDKNPWVVFIHGGGWAGGHRDNIYKTAFLGGMKKLVEAGVIVATVQYRLAKAPVTSYESVIDCKDAARYLLQNATTHKLDENNYAIWGGSAGGHLSLVTALVPDNKFPGDAGLSSISPSYKGVVAYYPFTSCLHEPLRPNSIFADGSLFTRLLGGSVEDNLELATNLSPTEFLSPTSTPVLVIHGENDTTLPVINATYMKEVGDAENADVEIITVANAEHSFGGSNISPSLENIDISMANYFLEKFGYPLFDPIVEDDPTIFTPDANKIYNVYNPRWDKRLGANGGDELIVLSPSEEGVTAQWKFTPVAGEEGFYYIDCVGGGAKPRITADAGTVSIMVGNTVTGDEAKWKFDYTSEDLGEDALFWISNKNGRMLRGWNDHVDIVNTSQNGSYTRYHFSESSASLGVNNDVLKENISIYPVPTSDILNIKFKESVSGNISLLDITGNTIVLKNIEGIDSQLDLSNLSSGFYIVKIQTGSFVYTRNVVKN
ncbi:alpha/beta hydrolase fold domain-containing protein [Seonamhaeicola sp. MEBiC1930]|uniref:alpha/beta hydrolase fold domain-containing protein n=1 Tax=Seonamhaeicola sp. MEBiC01930 TaxID=2976768 RepID=UPI0032524B57